MKSKWRGIVMKFRLTTEMGYTKLSGAEWGGCDTICCVLGNAALR